MTRKLISVPIFGLMLVAGLLEAASPPPQVVTAPPYAPDHVLIKFKSDASETDRMVFRAELQADFLKSYRSGAELWRLPPSVTVDAAIRSLQDDSLIEYVEPDCHMRLAATTPADANFPQQWSLYNTGQKAGCNLGDPNGTPGVDIDATLAWDISTGISDPNQRPIIAVIDTGVDYDHPDLASNMWVNSAEAT